MSIFHSSENGLTLTRLNLQFPHPLRLFAWAFRFLSGPCWNRDTVAGIVCYVQSDADELLVVRGLIGHCVGILQERSSWELSAKLLLTQTRIGMQDVETGPQHRDIYTLGRRKVLRVLSGASEEPLKSKEG